MMTIKTMTVLRNAGTIEMFVAKVIQRLSCKAMIEKVSKEFFFLKLKKNCVGNIKKSIFLTQMAPTEGCVTSMCLCIKHRQIKAFC